MFILFYGFLTPSLLNANISLSLSHFSHEEFHSFSINNWNHAYLERGKTSEHDKFNSKAFRSLRLCWWWRLAREWWGEKRRQKRRYSRWVFKTRRLLTDRKIDEIVLKGRQESERVFWSRFNKATRVSEWNRPKGEKGKGWELSVPLLYRSFNAIAIERHFKDALRWMSVWEWQKIARQKLKVVIMI